MRQVLKVTLTVLIILSVSVPVFGARQKVVTQKGIDVSSYQGNIDWSQVASDDITFAFVRCRSAVSGVDAYCDYNLDEAYKNGVKVGIYIYSGATNDLEAQEEADYIVSVANNHEITMPLVLDIEGNMSALGKDRLQRNIQIFCDTVTNAGYTPMVYASTNFYKNHIGEVDCLKWEANYKTGYDCSQNNSAYHQYTSHGYVKGIAGRVDMNNAYGYVNSFSTN